MEPLRSADIPMTTEQAVAHLQQILPQSELPRAIAALRAVTGGKPVTTDAFDPRK